MFRIGYAQEIFTPPVGVGLAGYFNPRPNQGMYDDLYAKVVVIESGETRFGFMTLDLCSLKQEMFDEFRKQITAEFGAALEAGMILSATHTHTGPTLYPNDAPDELTQAAAAAVIAAGMRALRRALLNLLPGELEVGAVYNNPYGFVRRYWMKDGSIVTNPGWRNPNIEKPECDFDRTIGILAVRQGGRIVALLCNIANHGDTIGGDIVSADWYGRMAQEIQYRLQTSLPVLVLDDASGDINHFDFHQQINQTAYDEAVRIGRGYGKIVVDALDKLVPVTATEVKIKNSEVTIPHRQISPAELAAAKHTLATVPDIPKVGDLESQDLANKVPAALRCFAQRVIDCHAKSKPSHRCRLTSIQLGRQLAFVSLPGEPFNGIAAAIRAKSPCEHTFVIELAQAASGYVPMPECFARGGYEVQPGVDSVAPEAATRLAEAAIANL